MKPRLSLPPALCCFSLAGPRFPGRPFVAVVLGPDSLLPAALWPFLLQLDVKPAAKGRGFVVTQLPPLPLGPLSLSSPPPHSYRPPGVCCPSLLITVSSVVPNLLIPGGCALILLHFQSGPGMRGMARLPIWRRFSPPNAFLLHHCVLLGIFAPHYRPIFILVHLPCAPANGSHTLGISVGLANGRH